MALPCVRPRRFTYGSLKSAKPFSLGAVIRNEQNKKTRVCSPSRMGPCSSGAGVYPMRSTHECSELCNFWFSWVKAFWIWGGSISAYCHRLSESSLQLSIKRKLMKSLCFCRTRRYYSVIQEVQTSWHPTLPDFPPLMGSVTAYYTNRFLNVDELISAKTALN
jgi:hypothetical protein